MRGRFGLGAGSLERRKPITSAVQLGPELITTGNFSGGTAGPSCVINGDGSTTITGSGSRNGNWSIVIPSLEAGATYQLISSVVPSGGGNGSGVWLGADEVSSTGNGFYTGPGATTTNYTLQMIAGADAGKLLKFHVGTNWTSGSRNATWGPLLSLRKMML